MKIIKQFEDKEYYSLGKTSIWNSDGTWFWGLGDDGQLYYRFEPCDWEHWYSYQETGSRQGIPMSVSQMKKIVKEFGHLLVWL